jgi:hypothetical protein
MKILPLIFLLMAIQMSLFLYVLGNTSHDAQTGPYNDSSNSFFCHYTTNYTTYNSASGVVNASEDYNGMDLWTLIFCPAQGNNTRMIVYFRRFALLIGAIAFIPFINRSDLSLLSGYFIFLLCAGAPTITSLYTFINSEVSALACVGAATSCFISQFFAIIVAGPLLIAWVAACVEWHTGRPVS